MLQYFRHHQYQQPQSATDVQSKAEPKSAWDEEQAIIWAIFFRDVTSMRPSHRLTKRTAGALSMLCCGHPELQPNPEFDDGISRKGNDSIHQDAQHKAAEDDPEARPSSIHAVQLLLDLDRAVLGKSSDAYQAYAQRIRSEFSFVPHAEYCSKRADILETFAAPYPPDTVLS